VRAAVTLDDSAVDDSAFDRASFVRGAMGRQLRFRGTLRFRRTLRFSGGRVNRRFDLNWLLALLKIARLRIRRSLLQRQQWHGVRLEHRDVAAWIGQGQVERFKRRRLAWIERQQRLEAHRCQLSTLQARPIQSLADSIHALRPNPRRRRAEHRKTALTVPCRGAGWEQLEHREQILASGLLVARSCAPAGAVYAFPLTDI
jgi:hypothetical protein